MNQHQIDLLPTSIRIRNQAGVRAGRYLASLIATFALVVIVVTHSRIQLGHIRNVLGQTEMEANQVLKAEARACELRQTLKAGNEAIAHYRELAHPLEISSVIATVVNQLPEGASLDRIDLDAGVRRILRSARSKGTVDLDQASRRMLTAELAGFALSDLQVAGLVVDLEGIQPFRDVSLDFSRTRAVRERSAREFRLSFRVDFEESYEVVERARSLAAAGQEAGDVE
ncbi:MAG: hypothetical protein JSV91_14500 [Phycisphaerales bacterium]|nr:MAG: hypothetical protein JSV91_14500 [Phycisphaerales bacterium]